jgi:hypothetical protein
MTGLRRWIFAAVLGALALGAPAPTRADGEGAALARYLLAGLDFDAARRELARADATDPAVALERARLALDELDCDGAAAILARREVQELAAGEGLVDVVHGCQRVTAALSSDVDEANGIVVFWQDEHDRGLAPLLMETVLKAREALSAHLGVDWPHPTRIVVVRDLLSLSAMTGLPYKDARNTGTAAIAKFGRVTLLSPRASHHGFEWRDTVAHELAHLAITRASRDRAPLWLQEGIAKREEVRWREPGPFDDRPPAAAVVKRGMELNLVLPLDKLGKSIAMLPDARAASVAFAEVTTFVRLLAEDGGDARLQRLLRALSTGAAIDAAMTSATGADLARWDARWRAWIASRPSGEVPMLADAARGSPAVLRDLRDRMRLAQLLLARGHAAQAVDELKPVREGERPGAEPELRDPSVPWLLARALEDSGRRQEGEPLVADPAAVLTSYGPWWATRGRWARLRGDEPQAVASFFQAVAADPFDVEAACETLDDGHEGDSALDPGPRALCTAARAWPDPPFGD